MTILTLFFLSGATALIYEVLWSKQLGLMLGSTIQAQTVVLAAFMGGLALGNKVFGRRADLLAQPLRVYGFVEVGIGLYAFFFDVAGGLADQVFVAWGRGLLQHPSGLLVLKAMLGGALVLIPTILMGGTLPLLAAWLRQHDPDSRRLSARFYAINSLGAVAGAWLGGFVLIRELGVLASLQLAALVNVLVGFTALALAKRASAAEAGRAKRSGEPGDVPATDPVASTDDQSLLAATGLERGPLRQAALLVAFTGGVSMGLEVLASRSLALIFGPSLQAFATVLIAFILGIGVGSVLISTWRAQRWQQAWTAPVLMLLAAGLITIYVLCVEQWVVLYSQLRHGLAANATGHFLHQVLVAGIAVLVLGLPAGLLGTVLPLTMQSATSGERGLAREVGRLLTWNTLGAVIGVLLAGFVFMPWLGLRGSFLLLAALLCTAVALALGRGLAPLKLAGAGLGVGVVLVATWTGEGWRHALGSGIFRARNAPLTSERLRQRRQDIRYLFYEDAADATVSVETWARQDAQGERVLRINGKPDASTQGDLSTQYLLAHLPLLARPGAKEVFVLGFGSGITAGAALSYPVERLTIAENCRPVLRASAFFEPWNRKVLAQPRTRVFAEDARTLLKLDPTRYDVIISEPSNPWVAGIGGVFSREFYELAASRLVEGGVMAQWFHIYEMHDGIVDLVLRTFGSVFPHMEIWEAADTDIILLGSQRPWPATAEHYARSLVHPAVRDDLAAIDLKTPEAILARQLASQATAFAIAGDGAVQTDLFPVLEYEAPRAFYIGENATRLFRFDERTRQAALAPVAKQAAAATLDRARLREVFRQYTTGNVELRRWVDERSRKSAGSEEVRTALFPALRVPIAPADPATGFSPERRRWATVLELLNRPEQPRSLAVEELRSLVAAAPTTMDKKQALDWSPGEAAALAVRLLLAEQKPAEAGVFIEQGRRLTANPDEFDFLERIARRLAGPPPASEGSRP